MPTDTPVKSENIPINEVNTPIKEELRKQEARRIRMEPGHYQPVAPSTKQPKRTTHWQRNWHNYAAAGVLAFVLGVGAAVAFGPFAPIVLGFFAILGKVLVGASVIASLSPALSTAVAWLGVMGTAVSFTASGWGLSKLFGLANDFKGLATVAVEDEALNSEPSGEKTPRNYSYSGLLSEFGRPSKLAFQEADAGEGASRRSSSKISSLPGHTTFMPEGKGLSSLIRRAVMKDSRFLAMETLSFTKFDETPHDKAA